MFFGLEPRGSVGSTPCKAFPPNDHRPARSSRRGAPPGPARGYRVARAPSERFAAVDTTTELNPGDSGLLCDVRVAPFLAPRCLGARFLAVRLSALKTIPTRPPTIIPRLGMMELVTETGSVKRRRVSIAYTATRAAEGIAIVGGCAHRISRGGKGVLIIPTPPLKLFLFATLGAI